MSFAKGRESRAVCDMCGFQYPYLSLKRTSYGTWVCPTDYDGQYDLQNHPQNKPPPYKPDPEGLEHPRPDVVLATSGDSSWTPTSTVGNYNYGGS